MLSLFHSSGSAGVCRLAVCAAPQLQRVISAAMSSSAATVSPKSVPDTSTPLVKRVRHFSPSAREWHDRLRTAWLSGWVRRSAPSNPCKTPKSRPHPPFQHNHIESSPFLGLGPTRATSMH